MNKTMVVRAQEHQLTSNTFSHSQLEVLKNTLCKSLTHDEFQIFIMACIKTQLDPFMRQIYAVKRKSRQMDGSYKEVMTIQTGIDGYRLIAERTGKYAPGAETVFSYDSEGNMNCATAYIKKQTSDGSWHTVSASAYLDEFCQKTRDGHPSGMWGHMPRTMLSKCAEAQALRKAFPAEMSGIYTKEEMDQADNDSVVIPSVETISREEYKVLGNLLKTCGKEFSDQVAQDVQKMCPELDNWKKWVSLPKEIFTEIVSKAETYLLERDENDDDERTDDISRTGSC